MSEDFYDLVYDVWRSGGNADAVEMDRFEDMHGGEYDWISDEDKLRNELVYQRRNYIRPERIVNVNCNFLEKPPDAAIRYVGELL